MLNLNRFDLDSAGPTATCEAPHWSSPGARAGGLRLIMLGAPGVGKGTQASFLKNSIGIKQFSTGDFFREAIKNPSIALSPAVSEAIKRINEGCLVPDDIVIEVVRGELHRLHSPSGVLFDGFPRTVPQAQALETLLSEEHLQIDAVLNYTLPTDLIIKRLSHRRICPVCKHSYHQLDLPPEIPDLCDCCEATLIQRDDDRPEAIALRLELYAKKTAPLIEFYHQRDLLLQIDCSGTPEQTHHKTVEALHF